MQHSCRLPRRILSASLDPTVCVCVCVCVCGPRAYSSTANQSVSEVLSRTQRQEGRLQCGARLEGESSGATEHFDSLSRWSEADSCARQVPAEASETLRSEGSVCSLNCFKRRDDDERIGLFFCLPRELNCDDRYE